MRAGTTLYGMLFTNCFFAVRHFGNARADFKAEMNTLAMYLIYNPVRKAEHPERPLSPSSPHVFRSPSTGGSAPEEHTLVPIRTLPKYAVESKQPRCRICNKGSSWACLQCTLSTGKLWVCHPPQTKARGVTTRWTCLCVHKTTPELEPRGNKLKTKRVRPVSDDEDDEMEQ